MSESFNLYSLPESDKFDFEAFQRGERSAVKWLFDRLYKPLVFFAENLTQSKDVDDIVGNSFLKLYYNRTQLASYEHIRRWLYIAVKNGCIDRHRSILKQRKFRNDLSYTGDFISESTNLELFQTALLEELYDQIKKLPDQRKQVLELYFFENMSTAEISEKMSLSPQTVRNHKSDALESLRKAILKPDWLIPIATGSAALALYAVHYLF